MAKNKVQQILDSMAMTIKLSNLHLGGEVINTDAKPVETASPSTISKEQTFFSKKNNLMEADWGYGPEVESGNFGLLNLKKVEPPSAEYEETEETQDEGVTPTYNEFYTKVLETWKPEEEVDPYKEKEWLSDKHLKTGDEEFVDDIKWLENRPNFVKPEYPISTTFETRLTPEQMTQKLKEDIQEVLGKIFGT